MLTSAPYSAYSLSTGALQGRVISATAPAAGQVLNWDGHAWSPASLATPLAFGNVSFTGTVLAGTSNISVTYASVCTSTQPPTKGFVYRTIYLISIALTAVTLLAQASSTVLIWNGVNSGCLARMRATRPAMCGAAKLLPVLMA